MTPMNNWRYTFELDRAAGMELRESLQKGVFSLMMAGNESAAAFTRFEPSNGGTHFYLTPDAAVLAVGIRWQHCPVPMRSQAQSLLEGNQSAVDALFEK